MPTPDLNQVYADNAVGAAENAARASAAQKSLSESVMSADDIKKMRDEAKLAIARGATALSDMGEVGGLQAPDWQTLQHMIGSQQYHIGDVQSNPVINLSPMAEAANAKTLQNRAMGLAQTDKVSPLTSAIQQQGEGTYSSPSILQNLFNPALPLEATAVGVDAASKISDANARVAAEQNALGITPSANLSVQTPMGKKTGIGVNSQYAPEINIKKYSPDIQPNLQQYQSLFTKNQSNENLSQNAKQNQQYLNQITTTYAPTGMYSPTKVNQAYDNFKTGVDSLTNDGLVTTLNTASKGSAIPPDQIGEMVSNGSYWTKLGENLGTSSGAGVIRSKILPLMPSLPVEYQKSLAEQVANGTIDMNGLKAAAEKAVVSSKSNYYKAQALNVLAADNTRYNSGQITSDAMQGRLNDSFALNSPTLVIGKNGLTAADAVVQALREDKNDAQQKGWDDDQLRAKQIKTIQEADAYAKSKAKKDGNKATPQAPVSNTGGGQVLPPEYVAKKRGGVYGGMY